MLLSVDTIKAAAREADKHARALKSFDNSLEQGMTVEVIKGRKIAIGTTGTLEGWGSNEFGQWVRVKVANGNTFFTSMRNVTFPDLNKAIDALSEASQAAMRAYRDRLDEAVSFCGIDLRAGTKVASDMHAYSDSYVADYACNPMASRALLDLVVRHLDPPGSSWGALRWSGGSTIISQPEANVVRIQSITCLCD